MSGLKANIIFVMGEDASAEHFGLYGNDAVKTPNIDALGKGGLVFTNAYTSSPQCSPTKASILTGRMPWMMNHPMIDHRLRFNVKFKSYAEILEQEGYITGYQSKGGWRKVYNRDPGPRGKNPAGKAFRGLESFLSELPDGKPFCYWAGIAVLIVPFQKPKVILATSKSLLI